MSMRRERMEGGRLRWPRGPALAIVAMALIGCGRAPAPAEREEPRALPLAVFADTGRTTTLRVEPPSPAGAPAAPHASAWLTRVSPARAEPAALPPGEIEPDTLPATPLPPPTLAVDAHLKPPLLRTRASLVVPRGARGSVELDVRVDEQGEVSEVRWADGARDSALVRAATDCARRMRFFPAERAGQPVAVWCRQRFDFGDTEP